MAVASKHKQPSGYYEPAKMALGWGKVVLLELLKLSDELLYTFFSTRYKGVQWLPKRPPAAYYQARYRLARANLIKKVGEFPGWLCSHAPGKKSSDRNSSQMAFQAKSAMGRPLARGHI